MKRNIFLFIGISISLFLLLTKTSSASDLGQDCTFQSCPSENLTCEVSGQTRLIKCYKFVWYPLHLNVKEVIDMGEEACVDTNSGKYKQLNEKCTDGTQEGECKFARKPGETFFGEPDETGETRETKTCIDKSNPPVITPPPGDEVDTTNKCFVDPPGGSVSNKFHVILEDMDTEYRYAYTNDQNKLIFQLTSPKKINDQISAFISLETGNYAINIYGYNEEGELKQKCTTPKYSFSNSEGSYSCKLAAGPPKSGDKYYRGEKVMITASDLEANTEYEITANPTWQDSKEKKTDSIGQLIFDLEVEGSPTIRILKGGQQVCNSLNITNSDLSADDAGISFDSSSLETDKYPLPSPVCDQSGSGKGFTCKTGLGIDIETNPQLFVKSIFGIILSISGGIALILIIVAGFKMMLSRGDAEKLKGAKESLTAAIIGLVFIIFSVAILEIIGVDLLKIPGFTR